MKGRLRTLFLYMADETVLRIVSQVPCVKNFLRVEGTKGKSKDSNPKLSSDCFPVFHLTLK